VTGDRLLGIHTPVVGAPKHSVDKESNCRPLASGGWVEVRCHGDESQRAHSLPVDVTSNGRCVGTTPCRKKGIHLPMSTYGHDGRTNAYVSGIACDLSRATATDS